MLKAAIYARKSTDDSDRRNPENKSVVRQVEHAKRYAEAKGWVVDPTHVYVDDGVSGRRIPKPSGIVSDAQQPEGVRRDRDVGALAPRARSGAHRSPWTALSVMACGSSSTSLMKRWRPTSAIDRFMLNALSLAAELEREKARQRSHDALLRKAEKGYCTGGRVSGTRTCRLLFQFEG